MISVKEAGQIIQSCKRHYGSIAMPLLQANGQVLAEAIVADRDLPPFDRVAMDGIAIRFADYERGHRKFAIQGVVGAGEASPGQLDENACFEIMTGAALPALTDTVIPYEHLKIDNGIAAIIMEPQRKGQNTHIQGSDKKQGDLLIPAGTMIGPVEISVAASAGKISLQVNRQPRIAIFSSGNELVEVAATPLPYQIRRSNSYAIQATLQAHGLESTMYHIPDDQDVITKTLQQATENFEVLILSGGISMGKFDYIPKVLREIGVAQQFYKVQQRPGKPFWFGTFGTKGVVFALPGNPVSTFMCLLRYVLPWLKAALGMPSKPPIFAVLDSNYKFDPKLQFFLQVKLIQDNNAVWRAVPIINKGSGDYASLLNADGFMELPADKTEFLEGEIYPVWMFR